MRGVSVDKILRYIGANVYRLRLARGWTQRELAEATHDEVKERYIQTLETGEANPTVRVLIVIANALGVPPADLFSPAKLGPRNPGRPPAK